jgi:hypothetical protein
MSVADVAGGASSAAASSGNLNPITKALQALGIGDLGKYIMPGLQLAVPAIMQQKQGSMLSKQLAAAGKPAGDASNTLLQQGLSGQAPQAVIAQANQTYQDGVEQIKQQYANMGRDPNTDTGAKAAMAKLAVARDAQIQQYAQNLTSQGLQAANIAQSPAIAAAQAAAQHDQALAASIQKTLNSLGVQQGSQGSTGVPAV